MMTMTPWLHLLLFLPSSVAFLPRTTTTTTTIVAANNNDVVVVPRTRSSWSSSSWSSTTVSSASSDPRRTFPWSSSLRSSPSSSSSSSSSMSEDDHFPDFGDTGIIILAGGTGSRMKSNVPKQFLILNARPVLHYSLYLFLEKLTSQCKSRGTSPPPHVVLVMDRVYRPEYRGIVDAYRGRLSFADPGKERQGSVENGLRALLDATTTTTTTTDGGTTTSTSTSICEYVAIHDSARPLVTVKEVCDVVRDAHEVGAAVLGVPCKATIKESDDGGMTVYRTVPRSRLWEVHTPQVVRAEALLRGFDKVEREGLEVTDDVSIIEALGETVRLTRGEYTNLKITTPEDMDVASAILKDRDEEEIYLAGEDGDGGGGGSGSDSPSLSSSSSSSSSKNPFAAIPRAGHLRDREYNSLREVKLFDKDVTGRRYPARPTPSRWHE